MTPAYFVYKYCVLVFYCKYCTDWYSQNEFLFYQSSSCHLPTANETYLVNFPKPILYCINFSKNPESSQIPITSTIILVNENLHKKCDLIMNVSMCIYANMIRAQINKTLFTIMVTHTHTKKAVNSIDSSFTKNTKINTQIHCLKSNRKKILNIPKSQIKYESH